MLNTVCKLHCTQYGCFDVVPQIAQGNCQMLISKSLTFIQKTEMNFLAWYLHVLNMETALVTEWMWSFLDRRHRWRKVPGTATASSSWSSLTPSQVTVKERCCAAQLQLPKLQFLLFFDIARLLETLGLPSQGSKLLISMLNLTLYHPWIITYHTCPTYTGTTEVCSSVAKSGSHTQPRLTLRTAVKDWYVFWAKWFCVLGEQDQNWTSISVRDSNSEKFMLNSSFNQSSSVEEGEKKKILIKRHFSFPLLHIDSVQM